jgi:transcriptional regulator with XRE-family HTH domain
LKFHEGRILSSTVSLRKEGNVAGDVLANDLRALRKSRGLTLAEIAIKLGRSVGWVSQVERGLSTPSIGDLRAFAELFGVPISLFFGHEATNDIERGVVVRSGRRRSLGSNESGLVEELLSPDLGGSFEMLRSIFAPGAGTRRSL